MVKVAPLRCSVAGSLENPVIRIGFLRWSGLKIRICHLYAVQNPLQDVHLGLVIFQQVFYDIFCFAGRSSLKLFAQFRNRSIQVLQILLHCARLFVADQLLVFLLYFFLIVRFLSGILRPTSSRATIEWGVGELR